MPTDIDECGLGYCNHFCNNTQGSFICSCQVGYALVDDRTCEGKFTKKHQQNVMMLHHTHYNT